ncbi:MAG: hypothetical protein ABI776_11095 [Nocardioidaceae bacterium]
MTTALTVVVVGLVVLAGLALATAAGAPLERASTVASQVAEALLVVFAVLDVARIVAGHRPDELVVHLGYVLVSVLLVPVLVRPVDEDASDDDVRGRQLVLALAAVAVLVVVLRQRATA